MSAPLRVGVVGLGTMGTKYAELLRAGKIAGATLAAVCNRRPEPRAAYADVPGFENIQGLLKAHAGILSKCEGSWNQLLFARGVGVDVKALDDAKVQRDGSGLAGAEGDLTGKEKLNSRRLHGLAVKAVFGKGLLLGDQGRGGKNERS